MAEASAAVKDGDCSSDSSQRSAISRSPTISVDDEVTPGPSPMSPPPVIRFSDAQGATGFFPGVVRATRWQGRPNGSAGHVHRRHGSDQGPVKKAASAVDTVEVGSSGPSLKGMTRSTSARGLEPTSTTPKKGHVRQKSGHRRHRSYGSLSEISHDVSALSGVVPLTLQPHEWGPLPKGLTPPSLSPPPVSPPSLSPPPVTPPSSSSTVSFVTIEGDGPVNRAATAQ